MNTIAEFLFFLFGFINVTGLYLYFAVRGFPPYVPREVRSATGRAAVSPIRADGVLLGSISFMARTFDVRTVSSKSASVTAVEPGGRRVLVAEVDWTLGYPGVIQWSSSPARCALVGDRSRLKFALEQRIGAVIDRTVFDEPLPPRLAEEIQIEGSDRASTLPSS
ncbi:hypothetical protein [Salininema proteolyticum]|uniref:Uncharacterized protein n=1 Tax=Salininema proteolyticum TaxID=1607685 RepID=A0ABV8TV63_9ACTN